MEDNEKEEVKEEVSEEVQPEPEEPKEAPKTSRKTKPPVFDSEQIASRQRAHDNKVRNFLAGGEF